LYARVSKINTTTHTNSCLDGVKITTIVASFRVDNANYTLGNSFILDSGSTINITNDREHIQDLKSRHLCDSNTRSRRKCLTMDSRASRYLLPGGWDEKYSSIVTRAAYHFTQGQLPLAQIVHLKRHILFVGISSTWVIQPSR
jgi:hypothetical protein